MYACSTMSTSVTSRAPKQLLAACYTLRDVFREHLLRNPLSVVINPTMECDPTLSLSSFQTNRRRVGIIIWPSTQRE